jgi:hypothetical protein
MERLDPMIDVVFALLLTREPALLTDMLEGILERPIAEVTLLGRGEIDELDEPSLGSEHRIGARVTFTDGSFTNVQMQVPYTKAEALALTFGSYPRERTPTAVVAWLIAPLVPTSGRLHSVFEFSEVATKTPLGDGFVVHVIDLLSLSPTQATGHEGKLERWARFLVARDQGLLDELAAEDPIMAIALRRLDALSQDPEVRRLAEERAEARAKALAQ